MKTFALIVMLWGDSFAVDTGLSWKDCEALRVETGLTGALVTQPEGNVIVVRDKGSVSCQEEISK